MVFVVVPISTLPSTGFATQDYTFLLWSRTQLASGVPQQFGIADFAPDRGALSLLSGALHLGNDAARLWGCRLHRARLA